MILTIKKGLEKLEKEEDIKNLKLKLKSKLPLLLI